MMSNGRINAVIFDNSYKNNVHVNILNSELKFNFKGLTINTESGGGSIQNPIDSVRHWNPVTSVKFDFNRKWLPIPIQLQYFYVGPNIVNLNSSVLNSSNREIQPQFNQQMQYNITTLEGAVTEYGQLTNNRQGINLSTGIDSKKFVFGLALSSSQEIENKFNIISYQHRLNGFNRSQFLFYRNNVGPYGRQLNTWRRNYEKLTVTDSSHSYKKSYNLIDFSVKYKTSLFNREIIFSNYVNYNSVQDQFSALAYFSDKAYLRALYEEFMTFYALGKNLSVVGLLGLERSWGNVHTNLAPNGKPIDQTGHGYGIGLDIDITARAGLYLRQRWYNFNDKNFTLDKFRGYDTNVEFKVFF